jgi:hypothetical protein
VNISFVVLALAGIERHLLKLRLFLYLRHTQ